MTVCHILLTFGCVDVSFYRVKFYPLSDKPFLHSYFKRKRHLGKASDNADAILGKLDASEKSYQNMCRARRVIRDIILCNNFDLFCTFTFDEKKKLTVTTF